MLPLLSRAEAQVRGVERSSMSTRVAPVQIVTEYFTSEGQAEQGLSERQPRALVWNCFAVRVLEFPGSAAAPSFNSEGVTED